MRSIPRITRPSAPPSRQPGAVDPLGLHSGGHITAIRHAAIALALAAATGLAPAPLLRRTRGRRRRSRTSTGSGGSRGCRPASASSSCSTPPSFTRDASRRPADFAPMPVQDLSPALRNVIAHQPEFASWAPSRICMYYMQTVDVGSAQGERARTRRRRPCSASGPSRRRNGRGTRHRTLRWRHHQQRPAGAARLK